MFTLPVAHIIPIRLSVVLTAGHCISFFNTTDNTVRFEVPTGVRVSPRTNTDGTPFRVTGYKLHPDWKCDSLNNCPGGRVGLNTDLALLKLSGFSSNKVICLNTDDSLPATGTTLDVMGFGLISQNPDGSNPTLPVRFQGATMTVSDASCRGNGYFCASSSPQGSSTCAGKHLCLAELCCCCCRQSKCDNRAPTLLTSRFAF